MTVYVIKKPDSLVVKTHTIAYPLPRGQPLAIIPTRRRPPKIVVNRDVFLGF